MEIKEGMLVLGYKRISTIIQVGCGGTGCYIQYFLSRLLYSISEVPRTRYVLCDGDLVENKNLCRQNFVESDLGQNKAEKLAVRYGNVYNLPIEYVDNYIEDQDTLRRLLSANRSYDIPVLVGAVDNNASRQLFHQVFNTLDTIIYIDSGNDEITGQVVFGVKYNGDVLLPPLGDVYPDVLEDHDTTFKSQVSCSEQVISKPQNIATNILAGQIVFGYLNDLLVRKTLSVHMTTFNSETMSARSRYIEDFPQK